MTTSKDFTPSMKGGSRGWRPTRPPAISGWLRGRLHNRTGEDNAYAHLKRQIMGREVVNTVTNGRLDFGNWERIFEARGRDGWPGSLDGRR